MTAIANSPTTTALAALDARRSVPARALAEPGPTASELQRMLVSRCGSDHASVPFRFLSITAITPRWRAIAERGLLKPDAGAAVVDKDRARFSHAPLVLVVVAVLDPDDAAIPAQERLLSAGCACFALLQAAQGLGFGATWLTGWPAYDPAVHALLGLGAHEGIAGFIHIGTPTIEAPERARPDPATLLREWVPPA